MFVEVHTPQHLTGQELDAYLERGWFRMGQTVFTTNFAHVKDKILSTIWLRVPLVDYKTDRTHTQLSKRLANFRITIQPAQLTEEKQVLFDRYRQSLPFTISESLQHLLFGKETESVFNTWEVTLHDGDTLFACGFFDLGETSAEGIVSFYNPAYKKYSPGKFLIYCKMQYCKDLGLTYFYPGYFVPGNPHFDYKLNVGREVLQFLDVSSNEWKNFKDFTVSHIAADAMHIKLEHMREKLQQAAVESHVLKYEFFDAGLIPEMRNAELLDFPVFLLIGPRSHEPAGIIIVFDVRDEAYHLLVCMPLWKPDRTNPDTSFYSAYFIKPIQEIFATPDAQILAVLLQQLIQKVVPEQDNSIA